MINTKLLLTYPYYYAIKLIESFPEDSRYKEIGNILIKIPTDKGYKLSYLHIEEDLQEPILAVILANIFLKRKVNNFLKDRG